MNEMLKKAKETADKLKNVALDKMDKAKSFIGDVSEVVKLEWQIAESKNTLDKLLLEYGKAYYYETATEEEKAEIKGTIEEVEDLIGILEASLNTIKEEAEKKRAEKEEEKNTVYCTNCGKQYKDKEKFCSKCGKKLNE